jgi:hypothetical protein
MTRHASDSALTPWLVARATQSVRRLGLPFAFLLALLQLPLQVSGTTASEGGAEGRFIVGLDFFSSHIGADDPTSETSPEAVFVEEVGQGGALTFGYLITPTFLLRLYLSGAEHDATDPDFDFRFSGGTFEGAYLFRPGRPLRPYLFGGLGGFTVKAEQDALEYETTGPGMVLGAGLYYFLSAHFAMHFSVRGEFINWDKAKARLTLPNGSAIETETPIEESGGAAKIGLGIAFRF